MDETRSERGPSDAYVSCMKINGVPLLPPLMTPEYRREMQYYKQLAAAAERRMNDLKLGADETTMNSNILPSDSEEWNDSINISTISSHGANVNCESSGFVYDARGKSSVECLENNEFESMNSQITVIDNETEKSSKRANLEGPETDLIKWNTSSEDINPIPTESLKNSKLSTSLNKVDRAEAASSITVDGRPNVKKNVQSPVHTAAKNKTPKEKFNKIQKLDIKDVLKTNSRIKSIPKQSLENLKNKRKSSNEKENFPHTKVISSLNKIATSNERNHQKTFKKTSNKRIEKVSLSPSKNVTGSLDNISTGLITPPKLVRQNSYTLKHPSPLLLAHLEEQSLASGVDLRSISMSESTSLSFLCNTPKQKSWESNTAKETWSSTGSDLNSMSINDIHEANSFTKEPKISTKPIIHNLSTNFETVPANVEDCNALFSASKLDLEIHDEPSTSDATSMKSSIMGDKLIKLSMHSENDLFTTLSNDLQTNQDITSIPLDEEPKTRNAASIKLPHLDDFCTNVKSDESLNDILKKVKEDHERKLAELIQKQEEEKLRLKKAFEDQQEILLSQFKTTILNENVENHNAKPNIIKENSDGFIVDLSISKFNETQNENNAMKNNSRTSADILNKSHNVLLNCTNLNSMSVNPLKDLNLASTKTDKDESVDMSEFFDKIHLDSLTNRTNNTLDDINSTFTSEDLESSNESQINYQSIMPDFSNKEWEGMSKLKSAYDKINRIQQNLASQSIYRNLPRYAGENESRVNIELLDTTKDNISLLSLNDSHSNSRPAVLDRKCLSLNLIDVHQPHHNDGGRIRSFKKRDSYREEEVRAANIIVAYAKGHLARRLMRTEKVQSTVQTIKDTLMCAIQLHRDEGGIRGADVDLHRRLIQQVAMITAACYALHDIFIASTPQERVAIIAQDRERRIMLSHRSGSSASSSGQLSATTQRVLRRRLERMSKSHTGVFGRPVRSIRALPDSMTRSHYEPDGLAKSSSNDRPRRSVAVVGEMYGRKPWR